MAMSALSVEAAFDQRVASDLQREHELLAGCQDGMKMAFDSDYDMREEFEGELVTDSSSRILVSKVIAEAPERTVQPTSVSVVKVA